MIQTCINQRLSAIDANSSPAHIARSRVTYLSIETRETARGSTASNGDIPRRRLSMSTERMYRTGLFLGNNLIVAHHRYNVISIAILNNL